MNNETDKKIPKTPLSFYIKLFCKKRRSKTKDKKVLIEATKSWVSLNKHEKQQFLKKYNEYQHNIKMDFANYLKNAEPYLKEIKKTMGKPDINLNIVEESTFHKTINEEIDLNIDHSTHQNQMDQPIEQENLHVHVNSVSLSSPRNDLHYNTNIQSLQNTNNSDHLVQDELPIAEPTPPKFITGEQLFSMINENEENNLTWTRLNNAQKRKYQQAVLSIKRKYLNEYKNYLEHLPSEKLFYHYKNNI